METLGKGSSVLKQERKRHLPAVQESPFYLLKIFVLLIVAVIVQTTITPYLTVLGAKPDTALLVVIALAMMRGPVWGAAIGFATGFLLDVALGQTMGISSFLYTLAGYFSGRYAEGVDTESWLPAIVTAFTATLVVQFLKAVIMFLLGVEASVGFVLLRIVLPIAVLNALLAMPLFVLCRWWMGGEQEQHVFSDKT